MSKLQLVIHNHIEKKKAELEAVKYFWETFLELNDFSKFSNETFNEVKTKVSSRIAEIETSIRPHVKLRNNI